MESKKELITRKEAKLKGLKHYFTGFPCKNGHLDFRYVAKSRCVTCKKLEKRYRNPKQDKQWRVANKVKISENSKNWDLVNQEKRRNSLYQWRKDNITYYRAYLRHYNSLRRARKLKSTPKWANLRLIREIYNNCPKGYEVDHIVPLKGKLVCGLHAENNLQYLTQKENRKKHNKYDHSDYRRSKNFL